MKITKELWGNTSCGKEIFLYKIENESGAYVQLSSVGAGVVSVVVPDKDGNLADVVLDLHSCHGDAAMVVEGIER